MNTTLLNLTPDLENAIVNNQEKVFLLLALERLTPRHIKSGEIIRQEEYTNLQKVSSWEDIKKNQLNFAHQVLDMFPENYEETKPFIDALTPLQGEALVTYLKKECGFYFFPDLAIAFSLNEKVKEKYEIQ